MKNDVDNTENNNDNIENLVENLYNNLDKDIDEMNKIVNEDNFLNEYDLNYILDRTTRKNKIMLKDGR